MIDRTNRAILGTLSTIVTIPVTVAVCFTALWLLLPRPLLHASRWSEVLGASLFFSSVGVAIALVLTPIVGLMVLRHVRQHRPPRPSIAAGIGALAGILPLAVLIVASGDALWAPASFFVLVAALAGCAHGLTWRWIVFRDVTE